MYVCMYVCMYIYIYVCIFIFLYFLCPATTTGPLHPKPRAPKGSGLLPVEIATASIVVP